MEAIKYRKKIILRFLKEYNLYQKYVNNSKQFFNSNLHKKYMWSKNLNGFDDVITYILEGRTTSEIRGGFSWECTKEGYDYWLKYSIELENFIYKNKLYTF